MIFKNILKWIVSFLCLCGLFILSLILLYPMTEHPLLSQNIIVGILTLLIIGLLTYIIKDTLFD